MRKKNVWFWFSTCILWISSFALIYLNMINAIQQKNLNPLFGIAIAIILIGILCMICMIKKVFHKIYSKLYPLGEKAEEWSQSRVVSSQKAYKTLRITTLCILVIALLLLVLSVFIS